MLSAISCDLMNPLSFQLLCPLALYCHRHFHKIVVSEFELEEQIIWNKSYASNKLFVFFFIRSSTTNHTNLLVNY